MTLYHIRYTYQDGHVEDHEIEAPSEEAAIDAAQPDRPQDGIERIEIDTL